MRSTATRRRPTLRHWSLRAHLLAIVMVVAVVCTGFGAVMVPPFVDPITHDLSIAWASPMRASGGAYAGAVVIVMETRGVAAYLEKSYGGPEHLGFTLVDAKDMVVSSSANGALDGRRVPG